MTKETLDKEEKERETFLKWLEGVRDKDDELFTLFSDSSEYVLKIIMASDMKNSLLSLFSLLWSINTIKLAIFDNCESDGMYAAKILYRTIMEHWLKANYIFARITNEKTDDVGKEYKIFCTLEEDAKYGNSIKWLSEILSSEKNNTDPWDLLLERRTDLKQYSKEEIKQKTKQFNYREIINYLLKNTGYAKDSFIEAIVYEYSELSSYVHGGPRSVDDMIGLNKKRFEEYKGMVMFTFNIHKMNLLTSYMVFSQFGNKDLFNVVASINTIDLL